MLNWGLAIMVRYPNTESYLHSKCCFSYLFQINTIVHALKSDSEKGKETQNAEHYIQLTQLIHGDDLEFTDCPCFSDIVLLALKQNTLGMLWRM